MVQLAAYGRGVDTNRGCDRDEGIAGAVAAGSGVDVVWAHLASVDSAGHAVSLEVGGDGASVDVELGGQLEEGSPDLVAGDEGVDLGGCEPALDGPRVEV